MRTVRITQCYDERFVGGTAVEVEVFDAGRTALVCLIGDEAEHGQPMVVDCDDKRPAKPWLLADATVLDVVEDLQAGVGPCSDCNGTGRVDRVAAAVTGGCAPERDCEACDGEGWR